jgi:phage gpG-like protein
VSFEVRITKDEVSPRLAKLERALNQLRPILEAVGLEIVSISQRAFFDSSLRASPWAPRKREYPWPILVHHRPGLQSSIRITSISGTTVAVGTDRVYAAVHQFGSSKTKGRGSGIPARPFFPIDSSGNLTSLAQQNISAVLANALEAYSQ